MNMNLIGVPMNYGCDRSGSEYAPKKLRQHGMKDLLDKYYISYDDLGDIHVPNVEPEDKFKSNQNIKYYSAIYEVCENLAQVVYNSLENENFPIIFGGDHSIAMGSISGASKYFENLGIVWLDAHGDFNTEKITESKNAHGMPLAVVCGYGDESLVNLYEEKVKVEEENVYHVGGRDFDAKEKLLIESTDINIYSKATISKRGIEEIVDEIIDKCNKQNLEAIHISLDIDFLDASLVPGTGTRVGEGYSVENIKYILDRLFETGLVRSIDFVEFNPLLDDNNKTLKVCLEILENIFYNYKKSQVIY